MKILIVNLMPTKEATETQLIRSLSNSPLQIDVTLLRMASHEAHNSSQEYLEHFYQTFSEIKNQKFDGMIVTGAPVEQIPFEEVDYWQELLEIIDWSEQRVFSKLYICWAAQAALYYRYQIPKIDLEHKLFGIYDNKVLLPNEPLMRGFDEVFKMPHSRHTSLARANLTLHDKELKILAESELAGVSILESSDRREIFVLGHAEYDADTLDKEYQRDLKAGLDIQIPYHYYPDDDASQKPKRLWASTSSLLYTNWLNYYVYQETPYELN